MLFMGSLQQPGQFHPVPFIAVHFSLPLPPFVVARAIHIHNLAQKIDRIFSFQFFDDFVFFPLPVTYSFFAPPPSTQYPFFNRPISTPCLAMMSLIRSTSLSVLLVCNAAYGFPFFGSRASSPSSRYRFTQADTKLFLTPCLLSISMTERCSSRCRWM